MEILLLLCVNTLNSEKKICVNKTVTLLSHAEKNPDTNKAQRQNNLASKLRSLVVMVGYLLKIILKCNSYDQLKSIAGDIANDSDV